MRATKTTNDIAVALRTPTKYAEDIKIKYGYSLPLLEEQNETIEAPSVTKRLPRQLSKKVLSEVINARYEELFALVLAELRRSGLDEVIASGIVLTGGASQIAGAAELAESVFQMPVRIGMPQHVKGLTDVLDSPAYATSVGLLLYGYQQQYEGHAELIVRNGMKGVWGRVKNWFQGNF